MPSKEEREEAERKARELIASLPPIAEMSSPEVLQIFVRESDIVRQQGSAAPSVECLLRAVLTEPSGVEIVRTAVPTLTP